MKKTAARHLQFCLLGSWVSDKKRTVEHLPANLADTKREILSELFGKLRVTYTDTTCTAEFEGEISTQTYQIVARDRNSIVIERDLSQDPLKDLLQLSSLTKITFIDHDHYWLITEIGGFKEYFTRIETPNSSNSQRLP